ncbi:hypothetical protein K431DRAFT_343738 [Polychaeton citri CBS 116435]|uniref:DUF7600 domain-containing protein n=1 Tax=Polychaeton citri CBS 116435 TaxID=1314669 RepID=A0A9P4QE96_9PEZI|nr:hypothetical protein K431DRAFT_343738 [Polychaeton citri CBS 116435]
MIAAYLPTSDVLSLRLCSNTFVSLTQSINFWKSRFHGDGERSYFYEAKDIQSLHKLIWTYKSTKKVHNALSVRYRRRVWQLVSLIADLMTLDHTISMNPSPVLPSTKDLEWLHVSGDIFTNGEPMRSSIGCRPFITYQINNSCDFLQVTVFTCTTGPVDYVRGMRFESSDGSWYMVGYCNLGSFTTFDVNGLSGFIVAVEPRGVHAIKVCDRDGVQSSWAGRPGRALVTERLLRQQQVLAMKVEVDREEPKRGQTLRQTALWFPSVPPGNLCLNQSSFTGHQEQYSAYEPLFWSKFTTSGNESCDLRRIAITYSWRISSIEFHSIGGSSGVSTSRLGSCKDPQNSSVAILDIDGAGERIQTLEATTHKYHDINDHEYRMLKYGVNEWLIELTSCAFATLRYATKFITNRARYLRVRNAESTDTKRILEAKAGSTIAGFFASQHPEYGLTSLGLISECFR